MAWKIAVFSSPSAGANPCDDAMEGRRGEGTVRAEPDFPWLCHLDTYLVIFLLVSWHAEMLRSFWVRSRGSYPVTSHPEAYEKVGRARAVRLARSHTLREMCSGAKRYFW